MNTVDMAEMERLIAAIQQQAETHPGVETYESILEELLMVVRSFPDDREQIITLLLPLIEEWPWGAVEILEFTMRRLRWPEIQAALEDSATSDPDFRNRRLARRALEVYEDEWENGEIYSRYQE